MIKFLDHIYADEAILEDIIRVKSISWPYSHEKQRQWIIDNLGFNDIHVLYFEDEVLMAYTNLIAIDITINGRKTKGYGIGNVCAGVKGKGYGKIIMSGVNAFLDTLDNVAGVLFCKDELVDFYKKTGWQLVNRDRTYLNGSNNNSINTMVSHVNEKNVKLEFNGKLF